MNTPAKVYGIGNPLIDIIVNVSFEDLSVLELTKGTMNLIGLEKRLELTEFIKTKNNPVFSCGGSCPNTVITLAAMGIETTLAGKVGKDEYGAIYRENLAKLGVHDSLADSQSVTGSSIILVSPDSDRTMNTYLGANREFGPEDVREKDISSSDFFHFTGYMWDTENQKAAVRKALEISKKSDVKISFDIADPFAVNRYREMFLELIEKDCDIVFANRDEASVLFDNQDPAECCVRMGRMCETAVVKNGKKGSFVCHRGKLYVIPVQGPETPIDTTGAGDTYAAGFLYGLCRGLSIEESGTAASLLAGQIIKQKGAQFSREKAESLKQRLYAGLLSTPEDN